MGVGGQRHSPAALPLGKSPSTHCIEGLVGPRAGLDAKYKKSRILLLLSKPNYGEKRYA